MVTQTMQTPEDEFKEIWFKLFTVTNKVKEKFLTLQISSVIQKFPEVKKKS